MAILITILASNVLPYVWVGVRFEDKYPGSPDRNVQLAHYKLQNIYEGEKSKMRAALVGNVIYIVMCYIIAILNVVILRLKVDGKPSHLAMMWLRYAYGPLATISLTSFLPPFISYGGDYTACMLFPLVLFTIFGVLLTYAGRGSLKHRLLVQLILNLYIFVFIYIHEFKHGSIGTINFAVTYSISVFWDGVLTEVFIRRT